MVGINNAYFFKEKIYRGICEIPQERRVENYTYETEEDFK